MMNVRMTMPVVFFALGVSFLIAAFNLPKARLGDPNGPLYFPVIICSLLVILSVVYFFQEWKVRNKEIAEVKLIFSGRAPRLIGGSLVLIFIYTFLFERIGFLFSTIVFLGALLFLVNGKERWKTNIIVAIVFSFVSWYSFAELLQVSLP
ncbi:tripartite tricarboxylate transporter TctB family protein [Virgibacillus kekensis]|uniref:Tripartite tricarboxylate transporter TctB family protein n=1 Tax=Virgibacillus kekensis TaxID=202261 RepID=A0ABV9DGA5_9BACI